MTRIARLALVAGVVLAVGPACSAPPVERPGALTIAAASDLRFALDELIAAFRVNHPGVHVEVAYGSSGNFHAQIANGAPYDLFLSADIEYPRQLAARGLVVPGSEFTYAEGRLAVWVTRASPLAVERDGLRAVADARVTRIAIANPMHAPYGRAAEAALQSAGLLEPVTSQVVYGENISQTLQFVQSGAADIGIVALSLAMAPEVQSQGRYAIVPGDAHPRLEQGGVIIAGSPNRTMAEAFRAHMMSAPGRDLLARYGLASPEPRGAEATGAHTTTDADATDSRPAAGER